MDLKDMKYFQSVVKHGSYTEAARALYISQPAISKAMKNLESELGLELIQRKGRGIGLTDAGQVFFEESLRITEAAEQLQYKMQEMKEKDDNQLVIGFPSTAGTWYWTQLIANLNQEYPDIKLNFQDLSKVDIVDQVDQRALELGIAVKQSLITDSVEFEHEDILVDKLKLLVHADHPLVQKGFVELEDLANEEIVIHEKGKNTAYEVLFNKMDDEGIDYDISYVNTQAIVYNIVAQHLGISFILGEEKFSLKDSNIAVLPFEKNLAYTLILFWKKYHDLSDAAQTFKSFVNQYNDK